LRVEWTRADGYAISTDPARLDLDVVHAYLSTEAYWSPGVPREVVERAVAHSLNFGLYDSAGAQAGFARLVTDQATFAWLADVFVLAAHRGRGLGVWLVGTALAYPALKGMRRVLLGTLDAHALYERFGFRPLERVERYMAIERPPAP
jgi:GNAT superfamily N-acetyltransferase